MTHMRVYLSTAVYVPQLFLAIKCLQLLKRSRIYPLMYEKQETFLTVLLNRK